jgi:histidinol-phosphate aminotransferase
VLRTFSKVYGLAGLRVGFVIGSAKFRAAIDAVRQPFSVNALAQAAAAEAILHQDDVERRVERTLVERVRVEEGLRELGLATAETQANFSWVDLGDADEGEIVAGLAERSIAVRPGAPLGDPGHIRVSYGTAEENDRFLAALAELLD